MSRPNQDRAAAIAEIAELLPQRNAQLGRLLWRHARGTVHRGMASVLGTLGDGPQAISQLAAREGVAQPTLTNMVARLEARGFVRRERSASDGRVVVVGLTEAGRSELTAMRERYLAALNERLLGLPDQQLFDLREASDALQALIEALRTED